CKSRACARWPKRSLHWRPNPRASLPRIWPSECRRNKDERWWAMGIAKRVMTCARCGGKSLVERVGKTRRYWVRRPGIRTLAALLILREQVIKPVLAGVCRPKRGRPPKNLHPLDVHYQKLKVEMLATLKTLKLAA